MSYLHLIVLIGLLYAAAAMVVLPCTFTLTAFGFDMPSFATLARWIGWLAVAIIACSLISVRL